MDVAVIINPESGKLTFARNAEGDFYFDDRGIGPVLTALFSRKGSYLWDPTVGTTIQAITKDGRATATRLVGAATEALQQVKADNLLTDFTLPQASLLRVGAWSLALPWKTQSGPQKIALRL